MVRRRKRKSVSDGAFFFLVICLIAPPSARIIYEEIQFKRVRKEISAPTLARLESLEQENALLRQQLNTIAQDRQLITSWDSFYSPRSVRALPVGDTSAYRNAFWIASQSDLPLEKNFAVVSRGALVGRVQKSFPKPAIALVQSLLDQQFVVRFKFATQTENSVHRGAWGILKGTGMVDPNDNRPLLDLDLLSASIPLYEGLQIFTDGGDGIYPRDLLIGKLVPSQRPGEPSKFQVRAESSANGLSDLVVLVDRQVTTARALSATENLLGQESTNP